MKRIIFTVIICLTASVLFAQSNHTDSAKTASDTIKTKKGTSIKFGYGDDASEVNINRKRDTSEHHRTEYPKFSFGITLCPA